MTDKELLTVKEYSEIAGVTQQAVYKRLNKGLAKYVVEIEGQKFIKAEAVAKFNTKAEPKPKAPEQPQVEQPQPSDVSKLLDTLNQTIELLQGQLAIKDSQIKDLNDRLEQALNNTAQSHYIAAQAQVHALESGEEPGENTTAAPTTDTTETAPEKKKSFWAKLFR